MLQTWLCFLFYASFKFSLDLRYLPFRGVASAKFGGTKYLSLGEQQYFC